MLIKVKVSSGSKKEKIIKKSEDSFEVWVKEKPRNNEANKAVYKVLISYLNLSRKEVKLIKGFKQRNKIFKIDRT